MVGRSSTHRCRDSCAELKRQKCSDQRLNYEKPDSFRCLHPHKNIRDTYKTSERFTHISGAYQITYWAQLCLHPILSPADCVLHLLMPVPPSAAGAGPRIPLWSPCERPGRSLCGSRVYDLHRLTRQFEAEAKTQNKIWLFFGHLPSGRINFILYYKLTAILDLLSTVYPVASKKVMMVYGSN